MLLLPHGLRELSNTFKIENPKSYFPFLLNDINYIGEFPSFKYFKNVAFKEYLLLKQNYKNKLWNFKNESIKYCKLDCVALHQVLIKFNELIFNEFNVNPHNSLTLPSLAMRIYKTHFMPVNTIYQLHGLIERNIRQSYTGGAVDLYIPHNKIGSFIESNEYEKIYQYDANSLYPSIMATKPMPIGQPIAFIGNIRKVDPNAFGFFYCKITSKEFMQHPILQRRIKTNNGLRTIAGLGNWEAWICSSEMDNAVKYGYTFEILKGYQFETGDIFSEFINKMYNLRLEYPKTDPMNLIAKLLMNSLYGKLGMKDEITKIEILDNKTPEDKEYISSIVDLYNTKIVDHVDLGEFVILIYNSNLDINYNEKDDYYHGTEVNIAIASTITTGARIFMSFFKNNPDYNLYYTDTDSIFINKPLPAHMVGSKLGQLKLENVIDKAVFLAPKVYGYLTDQGKEIIKVKGLTSEIIKTLTVSDLEALLIRDSSRIFNQEKWFKSITKGEITTDDLIYTLKITSNKRNHIYINEIFSNTQPYSYDEISNN